MTPTRELIELAERCEAATGPDRELDRSIERAIGWARNNALGQEVYGPKGRAFNPRRFTASLDAAMTLVPEGCASAVGTMAFKSDHRKPWACVWNGFGAPTWRADAATPALALCAAALRARSHQDPTHDQ